MEPHTNEPSAPSANGAPSPQNPQSSLILQGPVKLFTSAWNVFKNNWKMLVSIAIAPSVILFIGQLLMQVQSPVLLVIGIIIGIVGTVVSVVMQPAMIDAIHRLAHEPGVILTVGTQYKTGFRYFWSVLFLIILACLIFFGSGLLFLIPALVIGIYISLYIFVRVLDDKKGFSAFTESYSLVKGRWWGVFGRMLFLVLIYAIGALIIAGITFLIESTFAIDSNSVAGMIIAMILNLIFIGTVGPVALAYIYNLYVSLKETRLADVPVSGFKKWLVAFLIIGILVLIFGILFGVIKTVATYTNFSTTLSGINSGTSTRY